MELAAVILAAGEGTRMKSSLPKVLHRVCGKPMIKYVAETARSIGMKRVVVVVGHGAEEVISSLSNVDFVVQERQLGTGHAVQVAEGKLSDFEGDVLVLSGDTPLLRQQTLSCLVALHCDSEAAATLLTAEMVDPTGYGRVIRDDSGRVKRIVEEKDASPKERKIKEINSGTYCFKKDKLFPALKKLTPENKQSEFYLTDVVRLLVKDGERVFALRTDDPSEVVGVNSRRQLAEAERIMRDRINSRWMEEGVTLIDPASTFIGPDVVLDRDTIIHPFTFLEGDTSVGEGCSIGPSAHLVDTKVGDEVEIAHSVVLDSVIEDGAQVGPFCRLRPGTKVGKKARVGTFVETKKSIIGEESKIPHLSYIGDAKIGRRVNIGAGTITCNYDGFEKHETVIGDDVFVGSDTMLVAPIRIGKGAMTGAGSAITKDVPDGSLAIERSEQRTIKDWAKSRRKRKKK